jgi:hypothetical protein
MAAEVADAAMDMAEDQFLLVVHVAQLESFGVIAQ